MARKLEIQIIGDSRSFERALGRASGATGKLGSTFARFAKLAAAGLAGGLVLSGKAAIDFESSFAGVRKTVDGTEAQMKRLSDGIRDMAKEIPTGVNALNEIAESAGQLGIKREAILGFTRVIADLGETTNLVGEEGSAALARFANITQMSQKDFDRLGSTIVALGNAGASTEAEIIAMGLRIAAAGKQVGISEAKILGLANALSSVGIEAEAGGTAISRVMIDIEKSVRSGGEKLDGFARVAGLSSEKFTRAWKKDAAGALVTFIEGLGKLGEKGGNVFKILDDLGLSNVRVRDALLRAAGAGDLLRESLDLGAKSWKENTALTEEARKRYETTASQLGILKNNLIDVGISIGEHLLPILSRAAEAMTGLLEKVRDADGAQAKIKVIFAGVRGAVGDLFDVIEKALLGSTSRKPLKLDSGKIIEWKTTRQVGLVESIEKGLRGVDWSAVGQRIGEGISKTVTVSTDFIKNILNTAVTFVDQNSDRFAEVGAKVLVSILSKLLDPGFWKRNWELGVGIGIALFPFARLASLGLKALGFLIGPIVRLLGPKLGAAAGRAVDSMLGALGRLPGRVQSIILVVVSRALTGLGRLVEWLKNTLKTQLEKIPGWIRVAFKLTVFLTFVEKVKSGWRGVRTATFEAVQYLRRQWGRISGPAETAVGWIKTIHEWLKKITSAPWRIILKIPKPSLPDVPFTDRLATGVRNFGGGLALVGERGPELVNLPRGTDVYNAGQTRGMVGQGRAVAGGGGVNVFVIGGDPQAIAYLKRLSDDYRRRNGGQGFM